MAKPDTLNKIWASTGVTSQPSDAYINTGWTLEIPPYEYFNYAFNKWDVALKTLNDQGIFEWDASTSYSIGSKVMHNGIHFISRQNSNVNQPPFTSPGGIRTYNPSYWKVDDGSEVGFMSMYDGNTPTLIDGTTVLNGQAGEWVDDATMPGWYACVDGNQSYGCQNLVDRFVIGKVKIGNGVKQGANSYFLTEGQLPIHTHTASSESNGSHTHSITGGSHNHSTTVYTAQTGAASNGNFGRGISGSYAATAYVSTSSSHSHTIGSNGSHSHTITVNNTGSGDVIDNKPANYSVLYIRKCF